jgi:DNA polymerase III subunit beta
VKITCQRDDLLTALLAVAPAVPASSSVPALLNVKAVARDGRLELTAYDTAQGAGARYELPGVTVHRAGACVLAKDALVQILRASGAPDVAVSAGSDTVTVTADGRFELLAHPPEDFPDWPEFDDGGLYHEVTAGVLRALVNRTAFAADKKDTTAKFALNGVLWRAGGDRLTLAASDTKRLAVATGPAAAHGSGGHQSGVVPLKPLALLERALGADGELVRVAVRANDALFRAERATVYTALVGGKFPPHEKILERARAAATQAVPLPPAALLAAVRRAAIMTDAESCRVDMAFADGAVAMAARGPKSGSSAVELPLPGYAGPAVEVAFDPKYLTEFLKAADADQPLVMHVGDGQKGVVFTSGPDHTYLVVPLTGRGSGAADGTGAHTDRGLS